MAGQMFYASGAVQTTLAASLSSSATSVELTSISGYPTQYPFTLLLEWGTSNQEVVTVTQAATGSGPYTFANCTRGQDGTTGVAHASGAQVNDGVSARDFFQIAPVYNVCAYGADPTGTNDSTTAIQAALNPVPAAGGVVYLPAGTYKVSSSLELPYSPASITLRGAGRGVTVINAASGFTSATPIVWVTASGSGFRLNPVLEDFTINTAATGLYGIQLDSTYFANVRRVNVEGVYARNIYRHRHARGHGGDHRVHDDAGHPPATLLFQDGTYQVDSNSLVIRSVSNFKVASTGETVISQAPNRSGAANNVGGDLFIIADCTDFRVSGLVLDGLRDTVAPLTPLTALASSAQPSVTVASGNGARYIAGQKLSILRRSRDRRQQHAG